MKKILEKTIIIITAATINSYPYSAHLVIVAGYIWNKFSAVLRAIAPPCEVYFARLKFRN